MGPRSKDAVVRALGRIVDESLQQRHLLQEIKGLLQLRAENENADLAQVNQRVSELERIIRGGGHGAAPAPAE